MDVGPYAYDQGEGVRDRGKTGTGVRDRDMDIEEGPGKEIGGRRNENGTMDVWSYEAGQDKKYNSKGGGNESGGNRKGSPGNEVEVEWAFGM